MRAFLVLAFSALVTTSAGLLAGCTDLGVGAICLNPRADGKVMGTQLSSPALECRSRLCLLAEKDADGNSLDPPRATCTARCASDDDCGGALVADKDKPDARQCPNGKKFICAVATQTGPFACEPICICENDVLPHFPGDKSLYNAKTNRSVCSSYCLTNSTKCEELRKSEDYKAD